MCKMKYGIYAIRDARTTFMSLTVDYSDEAARRNFAHAVNHPESLMQSHPNDFDLYKLGEYDVETGEIFPATPVQFIVGASSLVEK